MTPLNRVILVSSIPAPEAAEVSPGFPFLVLVLAPVINRRERSFDEFRLREGLK
jgi:hypothetical protein